MAENDIAHHAIIDVLERGFAAGATDVLLMAGRTAAGVKYKPSDSHTVSPVSRQPVPEIIALGGPLDEKTFASLIAYLQCPDGIVIAAGTRHRFSIHGDTVTFRRLSSLEEAEASMENNLAPISQKEEAS